MKKIKVKKINIKCGVIVKYLWYRAFIMISSLILTIGCSEKDSDSESSSSSSSSSSSESSSSTFTVSEISQTVGSDGYFSGSFTLPSDSISFILSIFRDNNGATAFYSVSDPDGIDILSSSSTPNLNSVATGSTGSWGYANVLVPQSPSFSAKPGNWSFKAYTNDRVKLMLRTGINPSVVTIQVQPYITGTTWTTGDLTETLSIMQNIYSRNGITLSINDTITISDSQYAAVSGSFTDTTTAALVSQGITDAVNLFFIEDYAGSWSGVLGNAAGIPGSLGDTNAWNGVLNSLTAHASGNTINAQLLGETASHEMGHQLGLFHTTERGGTYFDILSDTSECAKSDRDNNSDGLVSAEECEGYGSENIMFWTAWSASSRSQGKTQEILSDSQQQILKNSPIAK